MPFTSPGPGNAGCCMDVLNVDSGDTVTFPGVSTNFKVAGSFGLGPNDFVRFCSDGVNWYQAGVLVNN